MSDDGNQVSAEPVFKKCARCGYSLRGLPAEHACPECGLRFDAQCELYRVANPEKVLVVWIAIICSGGIVLKNLPHAVRFSSASTWDKIAGAAAVAWFFFVGFGVWFLVKRYRHGYYVAVMRDGLIMRLPGFSDELLTWKNLGEATVKDLPEAKPQIASVFFKDKQKLVSIGGMANVFPTKAIAERFVDQVNARTSACEATDG